MSPARQPTLAVVAAVAALVASLGACAAPRLSPRPAHGIYDPKQGEQTTARALAAVKERGFELAFHDAQRGLILTRTLEGQATCGGADCLTRDTWVIRLEQGSAVAVLTRQLFDDSLRSWEGARDARDLDAVEADEVALLGSFLAERPTLRSSRAGEHCAAAENCESGLTCESRRCKAPRASTPAPRLPAAKQKR